MNRNEPSQDQLAASLERSKLELQVAVEELKDSAQSLVAPRDFMARHPYACVAAAFGIGVWLGRR